jgi:hypothetical protein
MRGDVARRFGVQVAIATNDAAVEGVTGVQFRSLARKAFRAGSVCGHEARATVPAASLRRQDV